MSVTLSIQNRQRKHRLDLKSLRDFAARTLLETRALPPQPGDRLSDLDHIGITLVSDPRMAQMHLEFMQIAGPTDVLTFDEGDIVISVETAARYAPEFGHTLQQEIALYILHGLLHLRGYDDRAPADARRMKSIQTRLFQQQGAALSQVPPS